MMAAENRQPTCAERLPAHLASRLETLRALTAAADLTDGADIAELAPEIIGEWLAEDLMPDGLDIDCSECGEALTFTEHAGAGWRHAATGAEDCADGTSVASPEITSDRALEDLRERAIDRMSELPLSVEIRRTVRVLLSTGGPGDWFDVDIDDDGDPGRVEYVFQDWFDGAREPVSDDDADTVRAFVQSLGDFSIPSSSNERW